MNKKHIVITALLSAVSTILVCTLLLFFTMSDADRLRLLIRFGYAGEYSDDALMEGAARGVMDALPDPYSVYFSEEEYRMFMEEMDASYTGIGIEVLPEGGHLTVRTVFPDSPAEKAGVLEGDFILQVGDIVISEDTYEEAILLLRTKEDSPPVTLQLLRGTTQLSLSVSRRKITLATVETETMEDIVYVRILGFDSPTAGEMAAAIEKAERQNAKGLILDVRNNPGGYLESVTSIADMLLPECTIVYTEDKNGRETSRFESDADCTSLPLVLLINEESASASEVLAGALKDNGRAQLVGKTTFGKGSVQSVFKLREGGVKMTVAHYYTAGAYKIDGVGISPHHTVENAPGQDLQLETALSLLK